MDEVPKNTKIFASSRVLHGKVVGRARLAVPHDAIVRMYTYPLLDTEPNTTSGLYWQDPRCKPSGAKRPYHDRYPNPAVVTAYDLHASWSFANRIAR